HFATAEPRKPDRRQPPLDRLALCLEPRGQLEPGAEALRLFVNGEAGLVGCDLEQDAARFAKIDRTEILPIENRRHAEAECSDLIAPHLLLLIAAGAKCDMVDRPPALPADRCFSIDYDINRSREASSAAIGRSKTYAAPT